MGLTSFWSKIDIGTNHATHLREYKASTEGCTTLRLAGVIESENHIVHGSEWVKSDAGNHATSV